MIGIVAVVLIHSTRLQWDPDHSFGEFWLKQILRFAVPGFLAVSGFLYATTERVSLDRSLRRLRRILLPYLVASLCAEAFWALRGAPHDLATIAVNLVQARSFGQYYYVFILVPLVLISPVLARLPIRILWPLFFVGAVLQGLFETHYIGNLHPIWRIRNPIMWWPYFLLGWLVRLHYQTLQAHLRSHRLITVIALGACLLPCWLVPGLGAMTKYLFFTTWLGIYFAIAVSSVLRGTRGGGDPS
ncbi:MAG: acyltransferase family protein [Deltaproteobacteria bacterium]|nr:acyltransferase family protein [Deltaproteobacteria bacterium]